MHPLVIVGGAGVVLYLALSKPGKTQRGLKNSGIGGAAKRTGSGAGVAAFPVGTVADSLSKLGTSIFGGSGTHAPVDSSIKPPASGGLGNVVTNEQQLGISSGSGGMVTNQDQLGISGSSIPPSSQIVTQLDEAQTTSYDNSVPTEAAIAPEDFSV